MKRWRLKMHQSGTVKFLSAIMLLIAFNSFGQTIIPDSTDISGSWTVANSPYIISGRAIVPNGQTLTIEPGVEVRLKSSSSPTPSWFDYSAGNVGVIRVQGEIIANGTGANPILFTRDNTGYWGTILIDENASSNSSLTNCIIEYAKESRNVTGITSVVVFDAGVSIYKNSITFEHNELRSNTTGLYIREVNSSFDFRNNVFFDNGANGIVIEESTVNATNNTLYNNSNASTGYVSAIHCNASNVYLVGNLIYNNDDFGIFTTGSGNTHIVNNTVFGNNQGIRVENGANTFITNTIVQNNSLNFATGGSIGGAIIEMQYSLTDDPDFPPNVVNLAGNILNSDAEFTNPGTNDFSLQSVSPCIDNGNSDTTGFNIPGIDVLGNNRIENSIIDIGATEFQQPVINYTVTTSSNPGIGGTTYGGGTFAGGSNVTVSATPNEDYSFLNWTENGSVVSTSANYSFVIASNRNLVANFESIDFTVTTTSNPGIGGITYGDGTFASGSNVTVSASPNEDYRFINWTENDTIVSASENYSFVISSNRNLVANFELTVSLTENEIEDKDIAIYPNPTQGGAEIRARGFLFVEIYDVFGKWILSSPENKIDLSNQPCGIYFLKIKSLTGIEIKRIIKN